MDGDDDRGDGEGDDDVDDVDDRVDDDDDLNLAGDGGQQQHLLGGQTRTIPGHNRLQGVPVFLFQTISAYHMFLFFSCLSFYHRQVI